MLKEWLPIATGKNTRQEHLETFFESFRTTDDDKMNMKMKMMKTTQ
jgi:hypothetical protein